MIVLFPVISFFLYKHIHALFMTVSNKTSTVYELSFYSCKFCSVIGYDRSFSIGYSLNVMRQSACFVFNLIMVDNYSAFFNCTPVGRAPDSMMAPTLDGWGQLLRS